MNLDTKIIAVSCRIDDALKRLWQTFYGFRLHLRLNWPGPITGFSLAPANVHDLAMALELAASTSCWHGKTCTSG